MNAEHVARRYGTPTYVYDRGEVRAAYAQLDAALPAPSALYYSLKANPHCDLGAQLATMGASAEISSAGELRSALEAGFDARETLMTGPGKTPELLAAAVARGVRRFSVDSPADIDRLDAVCRSRGVTARFLLRVNADTPVPGMRMTMTGAPSQFGADASWLLAEPERFASRDRAALAGLHFYTGTNAEDPDALVLQLATSIELAGRLRSALGLRLDEVNLGGGFGHPFARAGARPDLRRLRRHLEPLLDTHLAGWRDRAPLASFESGRYLVAASGRLVCRVVDVKRSKGRTFVILDSGIHHLGGMSGLRRLPRIVPELVGPRNGDAIFEATVTGPLCTPLDTWGVGVRLPTLRPGDVVTVPNVGAYGLTASLLAFLGHDPPCEVVVDGHEVVSATRLTLSRVPAGDLAVREVGPCDVGVPAALLGAGADPRARFLGILRDHLPLLAPDRELDWDAPLRVLGLDSLQAVALILEVEDAFSVLLPDGRLTETTLRSAASLWAVVDDARKAAGEEEVARRASGSTAVVSHEALDEHRDVLGSFEQRVVRGGAELDVAGARDAVGRGAHALRRDDDVLLAADEEHRYVEPGGGGQRVP